MKKRKLKSLEKRFWSKVKKTKKCWLWTGSTTTTYGYGLISLGRREDGYEYVHRLSWKLKNGPIPIGKKYDYVILHKCDVPNCVNPKHLLLGTQKDNVLDKHQKNRANSVNGEKHGNAKLTVKDIIDIRSRVLYYGTKTKLAKEFNISTGHVTAILNKKVWNHL